MGSWSDDFLEDVKQRCGEVPTREDFLARYGWVEELHQSARELLDPKVLREIPPADVYARLEALRIPQCPIRVSNLGRVNDAERIVESLIRLLTTQGGLEEKYRAAKFPQAGMVTITELLCVMRPVRFVCRNTAFTRGLARVIPLYTKRGLDELPYQEFLDICHELVKVLTDYLHGVIDPEWIHQHRYLLLYAVLTDE